MRTHNSPQKPQQKFSKSLPITSLVSPFLPMTVEELRFRRWIPQDGEPPTSYPPEEQGKPAQNSQNGLHPPQNPPHANQYGVDFILVTGDAYVDHPSFANAVIGRLLENMGYRVAILAQPDWRNVESFRIFGKPRIAWLVSAGNLDSMLNNYTASKRPRSDDQYAPNAEGGHRPDYATVVYSQLCRQAFSGVPVIAGGVEVSMRRLAHYDYWQDKIRKSLVLDSKADLVVYGMGEQPLREIVTRLVAGEKIDTIRDVRGTAYALGKNATKALLDEIKAQNAASSDHSKNNPKNNSKNNLVKNILNKNQEPKNNQNNYLLLPSYDDICGTDAKSKKLFAHAQFLFHREHNPDIAATLVQQHGDQAVVVTPPQYPMETPDLDAVFALPFNKEPHPSYKGAQIPAYEMVKFSINVMRGCFGGCTFCAITEHQGKRIQSRSEESILKEVEDLQRVRGYTGVLSDLGGPTANMYKMTCKSREIESVCRRPSCVHPTICKNLVTDHQPVRHLMKEVREAAGVKKVLIASGVRMDLANLDQKYIDELAAHHVGGHLKVAPEHVDSDTLYLMKKPGIDVYLDFEKRFMDASKRAGKEQYLVPYFVSSHPGCDMKGGVEVASFLKERNQRPQQVQDFIPTPGTPATCMWWTGIEPLSMKDVFVEKNARQKRKQRALLQYWIPENAPLVREALREAGRNDLIGVGAKALVPSYDKPVEDRPYLQHAFSRHDPNKQAAASSKESHSHKHAQQKKSAPRPPR